MRMTNPLFEMAVLTRNIKVSKEKKSLFDIELHGGDDRIYPPHLHIYKQGVSHKLFSIEVNLAHYLERGFVQFCRVIDGKLDLKSSEDCLKYRNILQFAEMTEEWLKQKPTEKEYIECRDNLEAVLKAFADEADISKLHAEDKKEFTNRYQAFYTNMRKECKILFVMMSMHKSINKKFFKYFNSGDLGTYKRAFDF